MREPHHFLDVTDLAPSELVAVLALAQHPSAALGRPLDGKGVALIFEKPSNRDVVEVADAGHRVHRRPSTASA